MTPNTETHTHPKISSMGLCESVWVCLIIQFESYSLCDHVLEATELWAQPRLQRSTLGVRVVNQSVASQLGQKSFTQIEFLTHYLSASLFFWFWNVFFYVASNEVFTRSLVFFTTPNVCNLKLVAGRVATVPSLNAAVGQDGFLSCPCHRKWQKINRLEICDHFGFGRTLPWHLISIIGLQRQGTSLDAGSVEDRRWQAVKLPLNSCRSCWFLCSRVLHWANEQDNINGCVEKVEVSLKKIKKGRQTLLRSCVF